MHSHTLTRDWVRAGTIALASLFLLIALLRFTPAPPVVHRFGSFIGSALPAVIGLGLYALLRLHKETMTLRLAVLSAIMLAFATVLQTTIQHMGASVPAEARAVMGPADPEAVTATLAALVVVLHMAKGTFSPPMLFFFSWNMLRHPRFGRIIGGAGIILAVVEYATKVYWFPEHGPSYQFPFTAAWLLVVLYRMATSMPWVEERIAAASHSSGGDRIACGAPSAPQGI